jgi:hypothetical protein
VEYITDEHSVRTKHGKERPSALSNKLLYTVMINGRDQIAVIRELAVNATERKLYRQEVCPL